MMKKELDNTAEKTEFKAKKKKNLKGKKVIESEKNIEKVKPQKEKFTLEEYNKNFDLIKNIFSAEEFLDKINYIDEKSKFYECLKEILKSQVNPKNKDFMIDLNSFNNYKNCLFIKSEEEEAPKFLQRVYLLLFETFNKCDKTKLFTNPSLLQKCLSIFHNLKRKIISNIYEEIRDRAIQIFKNVNFAFVTNYLKFFDIFNIIKQKHIQSIIYDLRNKTDLAIKYISIFEINDRNLIKELLESSLKEKAGFSNIKRLLELDSSFIMSTIQTLMNKNWTKQASDLYLSLKLNDENLKERIREKCLIKAFFHYYNEYLEKKIGFINVEEIFCDSPVVMSIFIKNLVKSGQIDNAIYVMNKQNFKIDIEKTTLVYIYNYLTNYNGGYKMNNENLLSAIKDIYKKKYYKIEEDLFAPFTQNCLKMALDLNKIKFIDSEDNLHFLELLEQGSAIGIDSEWKPSITKFDKNTGVAIMQLSNENYACVVDMKSLQNNPKFLSKLGEVLSKKKLIGFDFENDLKMLNDNFKKVYYENNIELVDLHKILLTKYKDLKIMSLAETVKYFLKKPLCKYEQTSNWERRPLRLRQLHYASLDAYVLVVLYKIMEI